MTLDPKAVEAAAIALNAEEACWSGVNVWTNDEHGISDEAKDEYRRLTTTAITAYLQAIEPQVREAVAALSIAAMDNGIVLQDLLHQTPEDQKEHVVVTPELAAAIKAKNAAHEAILALLGLEAE